MNRNKDFNIRKSDIRKSDVRKSHQQVYSPSLFIKRALLFLAIVGCYGGFVMLATDSTGALATLRAQANPPKNIILLIGDGMSQAYLDAASIYAAGTTDQLFIQNAPQQAMMTTVSLGGIVTDSAASASAMATGQKVFNGVISMTGPGGEALETSLEYLQDRCKSTGLVGTSYINHATAAAFGAHAGSRTELENIASDFFTQTRPNVLFGGTAAGISPEIAADNGYTVVSNRRQLNSLVPAANPYVSGQFAYGHMGYEYDYALGGASFYDDMPHLYEMARHAINLLSPDDDGFFLMVEGSRIDHAGHENNIHRAIFEVLEFDRTVQEVVSWAQNRDDTLVIVTADHETGGLSIEENRGQGEFPEVRWSTFAHTADPVPVFAWGPGSELVTGQLDNTDIFNIVTANSGDIPSSCESTGNDSDAPAVQDPGVVLVTSTPTITPTPSLTPTPYPTSTPTATPTPTPIPPFELDVNNSPRQWVQPGGEITYTIRYDIGEEKLEDVILFSRVPEGVALMPESINGEDVQSFKVDTFEGIDTIEWRLGSLPSHGSGYVDYQVRRLAAPNNRMGNEGVIVGALEVTKRGPETVELDQPIVYSLTITNTTNLLLTDIFVVDAVPFGATYIGGADAPPVNDEVTWWIDQLAAQEVRTVSYSVMASRSLMTRGYKVYNLEGVGVTSYEVLSTVVNDTPMPFAGDGTEIVNNGVWATWYHRGEFSVGRAEPIMNPTFDFYMPLIVE